MKVIVYQSYSGPPPPSWLKTCMHTVETWANSRGYDYKGDNPLFHFVPDWYREKAGPYVNVVADLARLKMAQHFLKQGYDRAIWLDADVVIFEPDQFQPDLSQPFLVCHEIWLDTDPEVNFGEGPLYCQKKVTNSLTMFPTDSNFLDTYIEQCLSIVRNVQGTASQLSVSTDLLTQLSKTQKLPLFQQLGLFSPIMMQGIVKSIPEVLELYIATMESPVYAANLCLSFRGKQYKGLDVSDAFFEQTVACLLQSHGADLNQPFTQRDKNVHPSD